MNAQGVINTQEAQNYQGTYTVPNTQPQHVCPACGHCPCCGRGGYNTQPLWPGYPNPYIGDPIPYPWGGPWYGTTTVTCGNTDGLNGLQAWN